MSQNFAYNYAFVDPETNMCVEFASQSAPMGEVPGIIIVEVPVNDPEYVCKYYIDGNWYEDAAGTIPWTSALL